MKNGADHIMVTSYYGFNTIWEKEDDEENLESIQFSRKVTSWYRNIFNCNKVIFDHASQIEIINQDRINFPAMYLGKSCESSSIGSYNDQSIHKYHQVNMVLTNYQYCAIVTLHERDCNSKRKQVEIPDPFSRYLKDKISVAVFDAILIRIDVLSG